MNGERWVQPVTGISRKIGIGGAGTIVWLIPSPSLVIAPATRTRRCNCR